MAADKAKQIADAKSRHDERARLGTEDAAADANAKKQKDEEKATEKEAPTMYRIEKQNRANLTWVLPTIQEEGTKYLTDYVNRTLHHHVDAFRAQVQAVEMLTTG